MDKLKSYSREERRKLKYHRKCRCKNTNKVLLARLQKRKRKCVPSCLDSSRSKRVKTQPLERKCTFRVDFCPKDESTLHEVLSNNVGQRFLDIKYARTVDSVRASVSDINTPSDASALGKFYHLQCLVLAERSCKSQGGTDYNFTKLLCKDELVSTVISHLIKFRSISMNDINKSYEGILAKYGIETRHNSTNKQELKSLLMEKLTNIKFVKKLKRNSPEMIEVENTVSEAVALYKTMNTGDKVINEVKSAAASLRKAVIEEENWSILQSSGTYKTPQLLTYFVTELLFGKHASTVAGK